MILQQSFGARATNSPPLAFGKRLFQERKIGERFHRVDAFRFQLIAQQRVIETALQMMHPGLEKTLAVETAPESDRPEFRLRRQRLAREIYFHLVRVQVHIVEDNDPLHRLLHHLRPPPGFLTGVVAFAAVKAEQLPRFD